MEEFGIRAGADPLTGAVIGGAIEVHKALGPGLLESAYQAAMEAELEYLGVPFQAQIQVPIEYRGRMLDCAYRLDLIVENRLIVELKAVEKLMPIHDAQLLTYLRLKKCHTGLLLNFNTTYLKNGIKRLSL